MEDYVLIDSVLQALHMSKFNKRPKHLKKYQLNNSSFCSPAQTNLVNFDYANKTNGRLSTNPFKNTMSAQFFSSSIAQKNQKNKIKMKFILQSNEKISNYDKKYNNRQNFGQFFTKRLIQPKSSRQNCSRTCTLVRTPDAIKGVFYDTNIEFIRKKSPRCIILPEKKKKQQIKKNTQSNYQTVNLKQLIKQQWQQQKRKRRAQSKTTSCSTRHRNQMIREAKRYQQELRNKQNQQKSFKIGSEKSSSNKLFFCEQINKTILPLTKDEIKVKAYDIMQKYGVDSGRCCFKLATG